MQSRFSVECTLVLVILALTGCIEYEEEVWINADGSGKIHFEIAVPSMMAQKMTEGDDGLAKLYGDLQNAKERFAAVDGLEAEEVKTYEKAGKVILSVRLQFDSWDRLGKLQDKPDSLRGKGVLGEVSLSEDESGNIVFKREVGVENPNAGTEENEMAQALVQGLLSNYTWSYTLHFPATVVSANAAEEDIDRESNTVTWEFGLASITNGPVVMEATLEPPSGVYWYLVLGVLLVLIIAFVLRRSKS